MNKQRISNYVKLNRDSLLAFQILCTKEVLHMAEIQVKVKPKSRIKKSTAKRVKRIYLKPKADLMTISFQASVDASLTKNQSSGHPIAKYDAELGKAYMLYPDGTKEYDS